MLASDVSKVSFEVENHTDIKQPQQIPSSLTPITVSAMVSRMQRIIPQAPSVVPQRPAVEGADPHLPHHHQAHTGVSLTRFPVCTLPSTERLLANTNITADGFGTLANSVGAGAVGGPVQSTGDSLDGAGTSGAANAGAAVGSAEESTLENAGSDVP